MYLEATAEIIFLSRCLLFFMYACLTKLRLYLKGVENVNFNMNSKKMMEKWKFQFYSVLLLTWLKAIVVEEGFRGKFFAFHGIL